STPAKPRPPSAAPRNVSPASATNRLDGGQPRPRLRALLGGLHLGGAFFTPGIGPTVHALTELAPGLLVPGHCTGWRAQHTLAAALPGSWVQGSSGTRYQLTAGPTSITANRKLRTGKDQTDE